MTSNRSWRVAGGDPAVDQPPHCGREIDHLPPQLEPTRVDARDVEKFGDEPGHPVGVRVYCLQHQQPLLVVEPIPLVQQRGGEAFDARERRPQLVRDSRDEVGAIAFGSLAFTRAAQTDDETPHRASIGRRGGNAR